MLPHVGRHADLFVRQGVMEHVLDALLHVRLNALQYARQIVLDHVPTVVLTLVLDVVVDALYPVVAIICLRVGQVVLLEVSVEPQIVLQDVMQIVQVVELVVLEDARGVTPHVKVRVTDVQLHVEEIVLVPARILVQQHVQIIVVHHAELTDVHHVQILADQMDVQALAM